MSRQITLFLPPTRADGIKQAWDMLADQVITDEEAGQRGAKSSKLFQMIAEASFANQDEAVRLLKEIKALHNSGQGLTLANKKGLKMDLTEYNIYVMATKDVRNNRSEIVHRKGDKLHVTMDMGTTYLAKLIGSNDTPRMLPKSECRSLTEEEKKLL